MLLKKNHQSHCWLISMERPLRMKWILFRIYNFCHLIVLLGFWTSSHLRAMLNAIFSNFLNVLALRKDKFCLPNIHVKRIMLPPSSSFICSTTLKVILHLLLPQRFGTQVINKIFLRLWTKNFHSAKSYILRRVSFS